MPQTDPDAPTQRILTLIEVIAQRGPITLADLTALLPFSRAAIWRALDTLRVMGWVRMRAGDNAFELRGQLLQRLSVAHVSAPEVEACTPLIDRLAALGPVHVDLGRFTDTGVFHIIESTRKTALLPAPPRLSLVGDDLAIAAQLTLAPPNLVLHLRAFLSMANEQERQRITSGAHGRSIAKLREIGHVWGPNRTAIAVSLPEFPGFALRADIWRLARSDIEKFNRGIQALLAERRAARAQGRLNQPLTSESVPSSAKNTNP